MNQAPPFVVGQTVVNTIGFTATLLGQPAFTGIHLSQYEGSFMSGNEEAKRHAEEQVSKELANQPKRDGPEKEESKNRRADAEEKLTTK
jgi:hypothetical protein